MAPQLQAILEKIEQSDALSDAEKEFFRKKIKEVDENESLLQFKADRIEKDRRTLSVMLEESIEDLEKKSAAIEAQNKELGIEAALERVRSVAMGMKKPEDMLDICRIISEQLELLHVKDIRNVQTAIFNEIKHIYLNYEYYRKHNKTIITEVDYTQHPVQLTFANQMLKGEGSFFSTCLEGGKLNEFIEHQKASPQFVDRFLFESASLTWYWTSLGAIAFGVSTYSQLNEESQEIVKRFRNVFDLSYRRYLDIEKAEAQAREAQIEATLERVRSRSMGMQKSDELKEVIQLVYEQFVHLNINIEHTGFVVYYKPMGDWHFWIADQHAVPSYVTVPYFDSAWGNSFNEAKEKGRHFFATHLNFEEKNKFCQDLLKHIPGLPEEVKQFYFSCPGLAISTALLENVSLYIENFSGIPYSDAENTTLMRFGKVFQQTYTRFLDLQKAEAQAREAQIEAALEKVRSRTMAMQRSTELAEVATVLFQQVKALGVPQWTCGFCIWEISDKEFIWYPGSADSNILEPSRVPLTEHPIFRNWVESRRRGDELYIYEKKDEEQADHYRYMMTVPGLRESLQDMLDSGFTFPTFQIDHLAHFAYGNLLFITYEHFPEMHDVFKRFAKVFEQTYTRFLDLQKAEAQAREAQIEAGLERVRYNAMAMQTSDDVGVATAVVFNEISVLGVGNMRCGITIIHYDDTADVWAATTTDEGKEMKGMGSIQLSHHPLWAGMYKAWNEKKEDFSYELKGEDLKNYYRALINMKTYSAPYIRDEEFPPAHYFYAGYFEQGAVFTFSLQPHDEEKRKILRKFTSVFALTFRRFLDLQKAEAQAREAQIEAALERVRAKAMAMHSSEDVTSATVIMFSEL
jgi:hypothetical protein